MMDKAKAQKIRTIFVITLLLVIHFISSYGVLEESGSLLTHDIRISFTLFKLPAKDFLKEALKIDNFECHPKLFETIGALFWKFLKKLGLFKESLAILIPNIFFLGILLIATYGITEFLYKDRELALLSSFLVSFTPIVYSIIRVYKLDFPLMCLVSLSIFMLLKTNNLRSTSYSFFTGIVFALSQLTKETFILFIAPVFLFYIIFSLGENHKDYKKILINLYLILIIFICLSSYTYYPSIERCINRYKSVPTYRTGPAQFSHYIYTFIWVYFHPILLLFCLPTFLIYLINIKIRNKEFLLLVWLIPSFVLFSLASNRDVRFLFPLIPPFLIASIGALRYLRNLRKYYCLILISVSIFQWLNLTYFQSFLNYFPIIRSNQLRYNNAKWDFQIGLPVKKNNLEGCENLVDEVVKILKTDSHKKIKVYSFVRSPFLVGLRKKVMFGGLPWRIYDGFGYPADSELCKMRDKMEIIDFRETDYILYSSSFSDEERYLFACENAKYYIDKLKNQFKQEEKKWILLKSFYIEKEKRDIFIYKRIDD